MTDVLTHEEQPSEIVGGEGNGLLTMSDGRSIPFKAHPLADLFPMMSPDEMAALVEDVRDRGVQRPIVLLDGMVLDGRNRYHAARDAGVGYRVVEFTGTDPVGFVIAENLHRRHLSTSQRAMIAAKIANLARGSNQYVVKLRPAPEEKEPVGIPTPTQAQVARTLNVGREAVNQAARVVRDGSDELINAVASGEVSVNAGADVATLPKAEQVEIVAQGPAAVKEAAKAARQPKPESAEPAEPIDPERRKLAKLTPDGMIDEILGLRAEVADLRSAVAKLKDERADLKAQLKEATAEDQGKVIGNLNAQLKAAKSKRDDAMTEVKRFEFKLRKALERVAELEGIPVDMSDAR